MTTAEKRLDVRDDLGALGAELRELRGFSSEHERRKKIRELICELHDQARDLGMLKSEIADAAGFTRQGLDLILKGNPARPYHPPRRDALLVALSHEQRDALFNAIQGDSPELRGAVLALQAAREVEWRIARNAGKPRNRAAE